ncbi:MAG TPA: IPT/TIG domain-containing protein [Terriglobales bacterium]|nr:IPT/TIG domain-containing protein [Terriglobales bacterium]
MRRTTVLFLALLMLGCGYGSRNYNAGMMGGSAAPAIAQNGLTPSSAMHGGMGFTLTVNGSNFGTDAVVYWNGMPQGSMYVTGNQLTAAITAADIMNAGMIPVYVRTGGQNSNTVNFTVQ